MLKRNGKTSAQHQLSLFDFSPVRKDLSDEQQQISSDRLRIDGETPLGGVLPEDGQGSGGARKTGGGALRGAGEDERGDDGTAQQTPEGTGADAAASARPGVGSDPGEIYLSSTGRDSRRLNESNYRIQPDDRLGEGSLKQKCRDNFAAIELARKLDSEDRPATDEERRALVKYVGWGGIPQVFALQKSSEWQPDRERLKSLLSDGDYEAARASTLNAHYTSPTVIGAIYQAVARFGFEYGRVLEPALGIGHFFGLMPEQMSAHSKLTGIEIDPTSASIASKLYPDADIRNQGFEAATLVDGAFDLAISNVPFGDYKLHDPKFNEHNFLIHDYFFAKGIEKVRPGGLMVFITSKGTLDKIDSGLRDYLHDKADFLGAIRLPNTAFKQNANTEVTADIIFLGRLETGQSPAGPAWSALAEHDNGEGVIFQVNEYFAANPHMMLGTMQNVGRMYQSDEPTLAPDNRNLADALREAIENLPAKIYRQITQQIAVGNIAKEDILAPDYVKENAYALHEGIIAMRVGNILQPLENLSEDRARRIRALIKLRDAVRETLRTQLEDRDEEGILLARRILNDRYDYFRAHFGPINDKANLRAFDSDPDLPLLLSLEDYNDETRKAVKT
ncbi:MAG TPA: hypothetical protein VHC44_03395, partial [Verrucomicrobiae bacterium]|nr:hypothetical protein [Verrucomicrobiae bacterium]